MPITKAELLPIHLMVNTSGISFGGLGSGLDTGAIIDQLVALERLPIRQIESDRQEVRDKIDRLGQFQTLVKALQDKAESFSTLNSFLSLSVSGADENIARVTAGAEAAQGSHTVEVQRLASVDRWAFNPVDDPDRTLGIFPFQGVSFTVGNTSYDIQVDAPDSSLNSVAARINEVAGEHVQASVINSGTASNPAYQLVLASKESGEDGRITDIDTTLFDLSIDNSPPDAQGESTSANNITVGNNAIALVDGLRVERSSNDFSDIFPGISLELVGLGTTTFGVEPDRATMKSQMEEFIEAYNDVIDFINEENTFTPAADEDGVGTSGTLFGDTALSAVRRAIQNALFNVSSDTVINDTEGFSTLSLVGITTDNDGRMSLDATKFESKINDNINLLADLFVDRDGFERDPGAAENTPEYYQDATADSGLFNNLVRDLDRLFGNLPNGDSDVQLAGIFDLRKQTLEATADRMTDRIEAKERALESFRENLILRYARLEELMGGLNAQGAALQSALSGLLPSN